MRLQSLPGVLGAYAAALLAAAPAEAQFARVTQASGLADIVAQEYISNPSWWLSGLHFVDLDNDGHLDLFLSGHGSDALATLGDGAGHFALATGGHPASEIHLVYDIDEDGKPDISFTHDDGGAEWWLNQSTPGALDFVETGIITDGNAARTQALIDWNRDGKVDWLRSAPPGLVVDFGDGHGGFTLGSVAIPISGTDSNHNANFIPTDYDQDGNIDLIIMQGGGYDDTPGRTRIWHNRGDMTFDDVTAAAGLPTDGTIVKGVGDFDQDGWIDLIAITNKTMPPVVYRNDHHGGFTLDTTMITGVATQGLTYTAWGTAVVADFDNDGRADVLMNGKWYLKLLAGTADGHLAYRDSDWGITDLCACSIDDGLAFGDYDGDGRLDIAGYINIDQPTYFDLYHNESPPQHWLRVRPVGLPGNHGAAGAKIRVRDASTHQLLWYEEVAIYCFQAAPSYYGGATTERHFGLGARTSANVEVEFYPSHVVVHAFGVPANSVVTIDEATAAPIFVDGFESGTTSAWSLTVP